MADEGTMRRIWRYKSDLEQEPDEEKLLEILGKLKRLPLSLSALQETGIGKVVNSFRKRAGAAGDLARRVVSSWKAIVEKEVTTSKNRSASPDGPSNEVRHEQASGDESDADSWNSFQEEEMSSNRSRSKSGSQATRKRKHFTDSAKEESRSSQTKHSSLKLDNIKADPDEAYVPAEKKKHVSENRDVTRHDVQPKSDGAMKVTSHTISLKTEGLQHSSHAHSDGRHQSKGLLHDQLATSNSHNHSVDGRGDRHRGSITVDRKQRRHNISSSEDEGDQAVDSSHINTDPSPSSQKPSPSSSSHKPSPSSSSHKPSSSSSSHKPSSSKSSNGASEAMLYNEASTSSGHHRSSPESLTRERTTSSHRHDSDSGQSLTRERTTSSHRHDSDSGQSKAGSSRSQTDKSSPPVERSLSSSKKGQRDEHSRSKHSSDKSSLSCHKDADKVSQKSRSSSSRDKSPSSHSNDNSYQRLDSSDKLPWRSSSSDHKTDSSSRVLSSDQSGFSVSSSTVHIKQERGPHTEDHYTSPSMASSKPTETKNTKVQSGHKRSKPKKSYFEDPELDLFSEALHIKTEPSSPVHRPKIVKQSTTKLSKSHQAAPPTRETPANLKVKSEFPSSVDEHNLSHTIKEEKDSGSSREDKKSWHKPSHTIKEEKDSGSSRKDKKSKHKAHRHAQEEEEESPTQDENQMSFEDFMSFDTTMLTSKGKSSVKSAAKSSSSSSSKGGKHKQADKPVGSKWASSLTDLPSSSKTSFSVPPPASNVTVTELDILSTLPETHASYKPLRFNPYFLDEDKGPSPPPLVDPDIIGTKLANRTHVYSGRKHGITEVKSLYDLCMQVLIDNIDAIDYVGIIPYSILKPVLERCTAQQLYQLEDYNPHFLEDTDELWKALCQRDFKGSKPQELENWRELYMRGFEERELKYQRLKQSMSSSITKGQAGRKAQLAYVDTAAKPPREVLRKQKQFGTGCVARPKHGPGSSSGLRAYKPSLLVPAFNPMDDRSRVARPLPPMMAKSMQMRKNMRR